MPGATLDTRNPYPAKLSPLCNQLSPKGAKYSLNRATSGMENMMENKLLTYEWGFTIDKALAISLSLWWGLYEYFLEFCFCDNGKV